MTRHGDVRLNQILRQLLHDRFRNKRKDFAQSIHVSESALSQYVRGRATPSLSVLVAMARELDVSLDYLVFGLEAEPPVLDYGGLVSYVEEALTRTHVRTATLRDFVGRVGSSLADEIESTATRLLIENNSLFGGALTAAEVRNLESISTNIRIATVDLDVDVLSMPEGFQSRDDRRGLDKRPDSASPFIPVIRQNVLRGSEYNYIVPDGAAWHHKARLLRDAVSESEGITNAMTDRHLRFFLSNRALYPGYVIYSIDPNIVTSRTRRLLDQIDDFIDSSTGLVALAEPTSRQSQHYSLIDPRHHQRLLADHDAMTRSCPRLSFD